MILTSPEARSTSTWLTPGMAEISVRTAFSQCSQVMPVTVITLRLMPESYLRSQDRVSVPADQQSTSSGRWLRICDRAVMKSARACSASGRNTATRWQFWNASRTP